MRDRSRFVLKEPAPPGVVASVRDARGGHGPAQDPAEIALADLIAVMEGPVRLAERVVSIGHAWNRFGPGHEGLSLRSY